MDEHHLRRIRIRRGTNSQRKEVLFEEGEFVYVNDIKRLYVGDRKTYGGIRVTNNNHVENTAIRPINSDVGDLLYNKSDKATYIVDKDGKLKKIIYSSDDIYKYKSQLDELELLLLKLEKLCCNTEFALDTDDGINILVDYGDWIRVRDYNVETVEFVECKPPIISDKYLNLRSNTTYMLNIVDAKSNPDIIFKDDLIDRDTNTPVKEITIIKDSVNASKDIQILEVTDKTIKFSTTQNNTGISITLGAYIDYSIQNSCSARQKEPASVTGIIYNTQVTINEAELDDYISRRSDKAYTMYKIVDPITRDYPWNIEGWFMFYFDAVVAKDTFYITEMEKTPKLINGNWVLNKKSYGPIGPIDGKRMFIFWHPKNHDMNIWNQGSGTNAWSCFPLFDATKDQRDPSSLFANENVPPTTEQIKSCLSKKGLLVRTNITNVYTGTDIPPFISIL